MLTLSFSHLPHVPVPVPSKESEAPPWRPGACFANSAPEERDIGALASVRREEIEDNIHLAKRARAHGDRQ
jgi:hypothetical protein